MSNLKLFRLQFLLLLSILLFSACANTNPNSSIKLSKSCIGTDVTFSISLLKTNNQGNQDERGINHVVIFNPKSKVLGFKVNVGLSHKLYAKDSRGKLRQEYVPKQFHELIADENAKLNGQTPFAAINADYISTDNQPQGLNISQGVEYSGIFKNKRSSFGISGGEPKRRKATIQVGKRNDAILNYNLVGGNGRFYHDGKFKDICSDLGESACKEVTNRSMVATTDKGYVILLVNDTKADSNIEISQVNQELLPDMFDTVLEGIARNNCLGKIQEGMLFDGGLSPGLFYNKKIYVENPGPIGSVFLIYKKET